MRNSQDSKPLRTPQESRAATENAAIFNASKESVEIRLESFPKYVRRQNLTRFLSLYELFKMVIPVKGSVIECGVNRGFGLMTWAKLSAILEPVNLTRRVYGFDTFTGFPTLHPKDQPSGGSQAPETGAFAADSFAELAELITVYDSDRFLGHIPKVELIKGNAAETISQFLESHQHLVVSLLFMDFDLYEPTKVALEAFLPRMPKGAVVAFDELDNPIWPGETMAIVDTIGVRSLQLQRLDFDPYISYAVIS